MRSKPGQQTRSCCRNVSNVRCQTELIFFYDQFILKKKLFVKTMCLERLYTVVIRVEADKCLSLMLGANESNEVHRLAIRHLLIFFEPSFFL